MSWILPAVITLRQDDARMILRFNKKLNFGKSMVSKQHNSTASSFNIRVHFTQNKLREYLFFHSFYAYIWEKIEILKIRLLSTFKSLLQN